MTIETWCVLFVVFMGSLLIAAAIYGILYSRSITVYHMNIKKISDLQSVVDLVKSNHGDCAIEFVRSDNNFMRIAVKKSTDKV